MRKFTAVFGLVLACIAVFSDGIGRDMFETFGSTQTLVLLAGIFLVAAALFAVKLGSAYRVAALVLLNTVVLIIFTELSAAAFLILVQDLDQGSDDGAMQFNAGVAARQDYPWLEHYQNEQRQLSLEFEPMVLTRARPFSGTLINVDNEGRRVTPGSNCEESDYRVHVYGGSSVWGLGVPDWGTLPACLQDMLAKRETSICVVNHGQNGYVTTQELVRLVRQLQAGDIPDLVLFFDGFNDVYAAFEEGKAGIQYGQKRLVSKIDPKLAKENDHPLLDWLKSTNTGVAITRMVVRKPEGLSAQTPVQDKRFTETMAKEILDVYLANSRTVSALGAEYDFEAVFFWQPWIGAGHKSLTGEEQKIPAGGRRPNSIPLLEAAYFEARTASDKHDNMYYLGDVFDGYGGAVWQDMVHVGPQGNKMICKQVLADIHDLLPR